MLHRVRFRQGRKPDVRKLKRQGDLAGLREAVRYQETVPDRNGRVLDLGVQIRVEAAHALGDFYGPEVTSALFAALGDRDERVRLAAVHGLRRTRADDASEALLQALAAWPDDRGAATKEEALDALLELGENELPQRFAAKLVENGAGPPSAGKRELLEALLRLEGLISADARGRAVTRAVAERVIGRLDDGDPDRRARAETVLAWVSRDATDLLLPRLDGPGRASAARLLGASRDSEAVEPLIRALQDLDPEVRLAAARSLGKLKDTRAVEPLLYASGDQEFEVREAADSALDGMGVAAVVVGLAALVRPMLPGTLEGKETSEPMEEALPWAERVIGRLLEGGSDGS
jgi:HEAT repeat protein